MSDTKNVEDCNCQRICSCYYADRKVVGQRIENDICLVEYETGEVQLLRRTWMDLAPQPWME